MITDTHISRTEWFLMIAWDCAQLVDVRNKLILRCSIALQLWQWLIQRRGSDRGGLDRNCITNDVHSTVAEVLGTIIHIQETVLLAPDTVHHTAPADTLYAGHYQSRLTTSSWISSPAARLWYFLDDLQRIRVKTLLSLIPPVRLFIQRTQFHLKESPVVSCDHYLHINDVSLLICLSHYLVTKHSSSLMRSGSCQTNIISTHSTPPLVLAPVFSISSTIHLIIINIDWVIITMSPHGVPPSWLVDVSMTWYLR